MPALFVLWAYFYFWVTVVYVNNSTDKPLTDVKIVLAQQLIWEGEIAADGFRLATGIPDRDGRVEVSYKIDGRPESISYGYVTRGPAPTTERCVVDAEGKIDCRTSLRPF
jgi:hypothetical protein